MVILLLVASQFATVPEDGSLEKTSVANSLSLADARDFHFLVQAALPEDYELEIRGFPRRKWVKGLEPFGNTTDSLGSWVVLEPKEKDGRMIRRQVLEIRLSLSSPDKQKWKDFHVVFDGDDSKADTLKLKSEVIRLIRETVRK